MFPFPVRQSPVSITKTGKNIDIDSVSPYILCVFQKMKGDTPT